MKQYKLLYFISIFSLCIIAGFQASAKDKHKTLTDDVIKNFIEKTTLLTSGHNLDMDEDDITTYLEKHLDEKARFKSTISFSIPGHAGQEKSLSLDKEDFMNFTLQGQHSLEHYENKISVDDIRISKDGQRASVKTSGFETGVMPVPDENGDLEYVPVEGFSECQQIIKLSKKGVIQMYSANCETRMEFQQF